MSLKDAEALFDHADVKRALLTVRKHGASHPTHNVDADVVEHGGDPNAHIPKPDSSFILHAHPSKIPRKK